MREREVRELRSRAEGDGVEERTEERERRERKAPGGRENTTSEPARSSSRNDTARTRPKKVRGPSPRRASQNAAAIRRPREREQRGGRPHVEPEEGAHGRDPGGAREESQEERHVGEREPHETGDDARARVQALPPRLDALAQGSLHAAGPSRSASPRAPAAGSPSPRRRHSRSSGAGARPAGAHRALHEEEPEPRAARLRGRKGSTGDASAASRKPGPSSRMWTSTRPSRSVSATSTRVGSRVPSPSHALAIRLSSRWRSASRPPTTRARGESCSALPSSSTAICGQRPRASSTASWSSGATATAAASPAAWGSRLRAARERGEEAVELVAELGVRCDRAVRCVGAQALDHPERVGERRTSVLLVRERRLEGGGGALALEGRGGEGLGRDRFALIVHGTRGSSSAHEEAAEREAEAGAQDGCDREHDGRRRLGAQREGREQPRGVRQRHERASRLPLNIETCHHAMAIGIAPSERARLVRERDRAPGRERVEEHRGAVREAAGASGEPEAAVELDHAERVGQGEGHQGKEGRRSSPKVARIRGPE